MGLKIAFKIVDQEGKRKEERLCSKPKNLFPFPEKRKQEDSYPSKTVAPSFGTQGIQDFKRRESSKKGGWQHVFYLPFTHYDTN